MSSLISQAGSHSDHEFDPQTVQRDLAVPHGYYQVYRYLREPSDHRKWSVDLGPEHNAYWITRKGDCLKPKQHLPAASEFFPLPVSAITALRTSTVSSIDSDDSHCSIPVSRKLVTTADDHHSSLQSAESESDSDQDDDPFENLNAAIINVLAPDLRLAAGVIAHLYKLPAPLRAFVYGFAGYVGHGDDDQAHTHGFGGDGDPSTFQPTQGPGEQMSLKRTGVSAADENSTEAGLQFKKPRTKRKTTVDELTYACQFNIYKPEKYCVRNEKGGTGGFYSPCMGPGFADPRHLKEHFASKHRGPQCQRCWKTFEDAEDLSWHQNKMEIRCEDRTEFIHEKETITEIEWTKIEKALAVPRPKKGKEVSRRSNDERWFEVWKIIFPREKYPDLPMPTHPHYVDPNMLQNPLPAYSDAERMIGVLKGIWDGRVQCAESGSQYLPSQEEVFGMIREAAAITNQLAQVSGKPAPPSQAIQTQLLDFDHQDNLNKAGSSWEYERMSVSDPDGMASLIAASDNTDLSGLPGKIHHSIDWETFEPENLEHVRQFELQFEQPFLGM